MAAAKLPSSATRAPTPSGAATTSRLLTPPNTSDGGKGYTNGVFTSGTTFHTTDRTQRIPVYRIDGASGMAQWVYGFIRTSGGPVWGWVIHSVRIRERNGRVTTYPGYLR